MRPTRGWMYSSIGLILVVGLCLGVVADRLLLGDRLVFADAAPSEKPMWFICKERGSLDIEEEPGYIFPERERTRMLERLSSELGLDAEQRGRVESYLEEGRHDAHEFWENSRHAYCDMRDAFRTEIRELLRPEQRPQWDEMIARANEREERLVQSLKAPPDDREVER